MCVCVDVPGPILPPPIAGNNFVYLYLFCLWVYHIGIVVAHLYPCKFGSLMIVLMIVMVNDDGMSLLSS